MPTKPVYLSKLFWLGVVTALLPAFAEIQILLGEMDVPEIFVTLFGGLIVLLRYLTTTAITVAND